MFLIIKVVIIILRGIIILEMLESTQSPIAISFIMFIDTDGVDGCIFLTRPAVNIAVNKIDI